jgi:F420H(2)-dependent quinone reductase
LPKLRITLPCPPLSPVSGGDPNGAAKNPAWYYNLAAHPDTVQIQIAGRTIEVSAEQLHGTAHQHAWRHITSTADRFAKYEQKTDRELPVIRLRTRPRGVRRFAEDRFKLSALISQTPSASVDLLLTMAWLQSLTALAADPGYEHAGTLARAGMQDPSVKSSGHIPSIG